MKFSRATSLFIIGLFSFLIVLPIAGQNPAGANSFTDFSSTLDMRSVIPDAKPAFKRFSNPVIKRFENGCDISNLDPARFAHRMPAKQRISFCQVFQKVSNELNSTNWSPELRDELQKIWEVFLFENVKLRPMRKGISRRVLLASEPFTRGQGGYGFSASIYLRKKSAKNKIVFLLAMHELQHIYDFYRLYQTGSALPEAEIEKRGFLLMGKIARETKAREKFKRLPKVWKDSWAMHSPEKIKSKMEQTVVKFMAGNRFYKDRLRRPNRYLISFASRRRRDQQASRASLRNERNKALNSAKTSPAEKPAEKIVNPKPKKVEGLMAKVKPAKKEKIAEGRLPERVKTNLSKTKIEPKKLFVPFTPVKAKDKTRSDEILAAAAQNERFLYYKSNKFSYDEAFKLQCWKKQKVTESISRTRSVLREVSGKAAFENEKIKQILRRPKLKYPSCLIDAKAIDTDASETFWSAPYLAEMPIKFDYFTKLNGTAVARYTVYKPARAKFNKIATKYPHIKPFRVFFGTIFVSVDDAQIIKFWGSSFPERSTTGNRSHKTIASYNTTATRKRLESGLWVTHSVNTIAVANKKGKARPFRYAATYSNYKERK